MTESTRAGRLAADAAQEWISIQAELEDRPSTVTVLDRVGAILRRSQGGKRSLLESREACAEELERLAAGSRRGEWDPLSRVAGRRLESTLRVMKANLPELRDQVDEIATRLPHLRAQVELTGDQALVNDLCDDIVRLLEHADLPSDARRWLASHLPGHRRPIPRELEDLQRSDGPLFLSARIQRSSRNETDPLDQEIWLSRIATLPEEGADLGTAALVELCRFADHHGLPITCEVVPDLNLGEEEGERRMPRLAGWYSRHGFVTQGGKLPEQWGRGEQVTRPPRAAPPLQ